MVNKLNSNKPNEIYILDLSSPHKKSFLMTKVYIVKVAQKIGATYIHTRETLKKETLVSII